LFVFTFLTVQFYARGPSAPGCTLRELHGVFQVAMGAARYGSWELSASSPDVTLAALQFRKGARFVDEYDLDVPWRHEIRIEDRR
jgi:hypothetical protein